MNIEEYTISRYMDLPESIKRTKQRQKVVRHEFYQQSFHTHTAFSDLGVHTEGVRPDKAVEGLEQIEIAIQKRLEITEFKFNFWRHFLNSLPNHDRHYFIKKYIYHFSLVNPLLDQKAIEEIELIEEAVSLKYNEKDCYLEEIELDENDPVNNMSRLLALVE